MSAITGRLPLGAGRRRLGILNAVLLALLAGAGVVGYLTIGRRSSSSQPVRTATAQRGVVLQTVSAGGAVASPTQVSVGFQTGGQLTSVRVEPGQQVAKGQILATVDATSAQRSVDQAQAGLATAQASYEQTLTGETAVQRRQDALSISQSKQAIATARATRAIDAKQSAASVAAAERVLRVDQGQEKVDLYQQGKDKTPYATTDEAQAAVTADQQALSAAQAQQQSDQQGNNSQINSDQSAVSGAQGQLYNDQQKQLSLQHQLNVDKQSGAPQSTIDADNNALDAIAAQISSDQRGVSDSQSSLSSDQSRISAADSAAVSQAQSKLSADQGYLSALQADFKTVRADEAKIASDRQSLETAQLSVASTAARDTQSIASAKMALQTAKASVTVKQASATPAALAAAKASVVQAQVALDSAQLALAETTLRAPVAGVVASVNGLVGTTVGGGGSTMSSTSSSSSGTGTGGSSGSSAFITLTNLKGLLVTASFSETDAARLKIGQPASVSIDALPNQSLAAHVISIASTATTSSSNVVTYAVTFALDRKNSKLKPGMTTNVNVVVGEQDNVVHVPTSAVSGTGANRTVTVVRNGKQVVVPVVAGLQGDSSTAILSGLQSGDIVVLPSVTVVTGTGSTTGTGGAGGGGGAGFRFGGFPG
jgi:multidrug efflux pump subunit AcrA (membrane-fusion protein)